MIKSVELVKRINPDIQDPVSQSTIYYFDNKNVKTDMLGNIYYSFPFSQNTFWTNFKYSCWGINAPITEELKIGIVLITSDGYSYDILKDEEKQQHKWYDTVWPIPSINLENNRGGIYFRIQPPSDRSLEYEMRVSLLGYNNLFPNVKHYLLLSSFDTYQFVFYRFHSEEKEDSSGAIFNVENIDYIRDILDSSCGIRLINRY